MLVAICWVSDVISKIASLAFYMSPLQALSRLQSWHTFVCELLYWSFWVWRVTVSIVLQMSKIVIMKKIASFVGMCVAAHNIIGMVTVSVWNFRSSLVHSLFLLKIIHLDGLGFLPLHCFWYPEAILSYIHERCDLWGGKLEVKGVTSPSTSYSDTRPS